MHESIRTRLLRLLRNEPRAVLFAELRSRLGCWRTELTRALACTWFRVYLDRDTEDIDIGDLDEAFIEITAAGRNVCLLAVPGHLARCRQLVARASNVYPL